MIILENGAPELSQYETRRYAITTTMCTHMTFWRAGGAGATMPVIETDNGYKARIPDNLIANYGYIEASATISDGNGSADVVDTGRFYVRENAIPENYAPDDYESPVYQGLYALIRSMQSRMDAGEFVGETGPVGPQGDPAPADLVVPAVNAYIAEYLRLHPEATIDEDIIRSAVNAWLANHPEATTTVQDGAISAAKLAPAVRENVEAVPGLKQDFSYQFGEYSEITPSPEIIAGELVKSVSNTPTIGTSSSNSRTDFIPVLAGDKIVIKYSGLNPYGAFGFFTLDKAGISGSYYSIDTEGNELDVPDGASFIVWSAMTSRLSNVSLMIKRKANGAVQIAFEEQDARISALEAKPSVKTHEDVALFVSMMPDFFWVSTNEIAAFSASLPKYKEGTVKADNNAWFAITGNAGDDYVTVVSGGNGDIADITSAEKQKPFGCVFCGDDGQYYPCNAQYRTDSTFTIYPPLKANIAHGELAQIKTGIHLSRRGYRAYAQHLYNANPKYCDKSKYLAMWRADLNSTEFPFVSYGFQNNLRYYATCVDINISESYIDKLQRTSYRFGRTDSWLESDTETGIEWDVPINGNEGYVEAYVGVSGTVGTDYEMDAADAIHIELWVDGEKISEKIKNSKICERICLDYDGGKNAKLKIYSAYWHGGKKFVFLNRITWWVTASKQKAKLIDTGAVVGQLYDSWGEFDDAESAFYISKQINEDAGVSVPYFNGSLSNQTSAWGKAWFYDKIFQHHPSIMLTDFAINDSITGAGGSSLPTTIAGPDGTIYNNVITPEIYNDNMKVIISQALNNGIKPILVGVALGEKQAYQNGFIDFQAEQV